MAVVERVAMMRKRISMVRMALENYIMIQIQYSMKTKKTQMGISLITIRPYNLISMARMPRQPIKENAKC